ncbi:16S rRNA (guanine(966)-N(2))-methyltransferase [secondary endosymbiont of Ctenarytaina eucalypti]|nr:16S rRNA (guanine(966)-N(2))-methyltransferase [secondary endosymbiont of Ctenarytaina eucalypti]
MHHKKVISNTNSPRSAGHIRIIGGCWRGRKLPVPNRSGLRPTSDRIRETLFNWLEPVIQKAHCLDCFAGSGALGLEALSRGAASLTLLEQDRSVSSLLVRNLRVLKAQQARVVTTNSLRWLAQTGNTFNLVFIDPPFRQCLINKTVDVLEQYRRLSNGAWIYIETEIEALTLQMPAHWALHRGKVTGQVAYRLYIRHPTKIF